MSDLEFIAPAKATTVTFALDPVQNTIADLVMLTSTETSGFAEWVKKTADSIPEELMETTRGVREFVGYFADKQVWSSFPDWLESISSSDPYEVRDKALDSLISHAQRALGDDDGDIPTSAQLLEDQEAFIKLMERVYEAKGKHYVDGCCDVEYIFFQDPITNQKLAVDHLQMMWEKYLQSEWEHNTPMLQDSITAFETIDFSGKSLEEIVRQVADREAPEKWQGLLDDIEEIIFVPSPHIGPYLIATIDDETMKVVFGARIPKGAGVASPALSRSELITRLNALADDTRLRIMDLLAQEGEMGAQEIISKLSLSQSATSRHLRQLTATGYLVEQRRDGAKCYRLNPSRIDDAFSALKDFLG